MRIDKATELRCMAGLTGDAFAAKLTRAMHSASGITRLAIARARLLARGEGGR